MCKERSRNYSADACQVGGVDKIELKVDCVDEAMVSMVVSSIRLPQALEKVFIVSTDS